jgi:hypothetical protein
MTEGIIISRAHSFHTIAEPLRSSFLNTVMPAAKASSKNLQPLLKTQITPQIPRMALSRYRITALKKLIPLPGMLITALY